MCRRSSPARPARRAPVAGLGLALALTLLGSAVGAQPPTGFHYVEALDLARFDQKGRLRRVVVDGSTGLAVPAPAARPGKKQKPAVGLPPWIEARQVDPGKGLHQQILPDHSMFRPEQLDREIRDDLGFAAGVDPKRDAIVLSRKNYHPGPEGRSAVSNLLGLIQGDEVYLGQLEMRWTKEGRGVHVLRSQQRAGPLLANGFPALSTFELVQTGSADRRQRARMGRIILVFPSSQDAPARVVTHLVGEFRRQRAGQFETRRVHLVCTFRSKGAGVAIELRSSNGESYPFLSWEEALTYEHESAWRPAGAASGEATPWQRPFHPTAPATQGLRPMPMVSLLQLSARFFRGGYSGGAIRGGRTPKGDRWTLSDKEFFVPGGMWQFDRKGELVLVTPLGSLDSRRVQAWFKAQFAAAKGQPEARASLRDALEVILNWAADLPQRPGAGPGTTAPAVSKLLDEG